ncbi:MAG: type II secretion system protein N [Pseudomonadota bacterium]
MRQSWLLTLVGLIVFVGVIVATLPASVLVGRLPPDLAVEGVVGTLWNGSADSIRLQGAPLGALSWTAEPLALLSGKLAYHIEVTRPDGFLRGRVAATLGGALEADGVELSLPVTALHPEHGPQAWDGTLSGHLARARLEHGWPVALVGAFTVSKLRPPGSALAIGSYAIEFDGRANTPAQLVGRVRDVDAPLLVRGQLQISHERAYKLEGEVTPRPSASADVSRAVAFLGTPDASGRRAFEVTGTF